MKLTLLLFLALICVSAVTAGRFTDRQKWLRFKARHNKVYADDEARFTVFRDNLRAVEKLNREEAKSGGSAKFGITKFMDLTPEEFRTAYLMPKGLFNELPNGTVAAPKSTGSIPTSFDWRDNATPVISAVKNQEQCGSCWAFSATEEIESFWALAGNTLTDLSPQQIVSCDTTADGCNGGWTYLAYQYVESAGGIESEADYPYKAVTGKCEFNSADVVAKISGWSYVTQSKDETVMATFMASTGPISVCVDAASWQYYTSGVLKRCGTEIDHCVQAVGYSVDSSNTPYWIVRNSWGTDWGIEGYIYVYRGADTCAIAQVATSVTAS